MPVRHNVDENSVPPWTRGDFRGFGAVTDNLVWVVRSEAHPGAGRDPSEGRFSGSLPCRLL